MGPHPARLADVSVRFLGDLGVDDSLIPDEFEQRTMLYRSMLHNRRVLVVLDDVADESQVLPLLPGSSGCGVLVTSRARLTALGRHVDGPCLVDHPAGVRALMLEFLGHVRAKPATRGHRAGQRLSPASVQHLASDVEQFYVSMADNTDAAATALAEPGLATARATACGLLPAR